MAAQKMPISSATITVDSGETVQIYDQYGYIAGTDDALVVPPEGSFVLEITTQDIYAFEGQSLGGGGPEWVVLEDATVGGTVAKIKVVGTAPAGVEGPVTFTVNGQLDGDTYVFPDVDVPLSLTVTESEVEPIEDETSWTFPDGADVGGGFLNLRRLRMHADSVTYPEGGITLPAEILPEAIVSVTAKGGILSELDRATGTLRLYTANGTEAVGETLEDVDIVILGRSR